MVPVDRGVVGEHACVQPNDASQAFETQWLEVQ
jgi:hypothetical protein